MNKKIFLVLMFSLIARIIYFVYDQIIWWDAAVYLSMGKFIFSSGALGFWEPIRPLLWPFILGYGWWIGVNPIIWGHIFSTLFSLSGIYLVYLIGKKLYSEDIGILSSVLISFTWIFFFFNARLYTEIPAVFFMLLAVYCFLEEKNLLSGFFLELAVMSKFPAGLLLIILLIFSWKNIKNILELIAGFLVIVVPYLAFNYLYYGDAFSTILFAQEFLRYAGIWIFSQPWWYYFWEILKQNVLYVFAGFGVYFAFKKKEYLLTTICVAFLVYFSIMAHKEIRFAIMFLPFLAIIAAVGFMRILRNKESLVIITLLIFIISFSVPAIVENGYFNYFEDKELSGELLVVHPLVGYNAEKATLMYYPWFNSTMADYWLEYIEDNDVEYVALDNCEGGFLCDPLDLECENKKEKIYSYLENNYEEVLYSQSGYCEYIIYKITY
ncbi:glycosyltransferase family 39 protein [Candidatus Woesearchaeota archaeon]|nr:glycosyltransferase family 39 protein [Candidatus Woesearchaeota archaeon]